MKSTTLKNEILFWKVIHNKYLLKLIFNHIHTTRWVEYKELNQIHVDNRMKFKEMDTLEFMVENCQFQILKYKLEKNDYFQIDKESIGKLFSTIHEMNKDQSFKLKLLKCTSTQSPESLIQLFKDILILLLNKKRNEFEICDLTKLAIRCDCMFAFNILINDTFNIKVYPSTLEVGIQFCSVETVKTLINLQIKTYGKIIIGKDLKKKSIILASNNQDHYQEMIGFIFSNCNLYTVPTPQQIKSSKSQRPKKKAKKEETFSEDEDEEVSDDDIEFDKLLKLKETKVSFKVFKSLKSLEIKNKLMEWDLVSKLLDQDCTNITFNYESFALPFDELLFTYRAHKKYCSLTQISNEINKEIERIIKNTSGKGYNKSKELQKLIIVKDGEYPPISYQEYMLYYKESISEFHKNNNNNEIISKNDCSNKSNLINLYAYIDQILSNKYHGDLLNKSKQQINCIPILNDLEYRDGEKCGVFVIKEKSTIEWLAKNIQFFPYFKVLLYEIYRGKIEFSTFELFKFATTSGLDLKIFNKESSLVPFFINAIKSYDIKQLKIIQSTSIKLTKIGKEYSFNETTNNQEAIIKLIEYLNQNNYLNYSLTCFANLFDHLVNVIPDACETIKLKLCVFSNGVELSNLIMNSIYESKFKLTEFLLCNIKDGSLVIPNDHLVKIESKPKYIYNESAEIYQICNQEPDQIVQVIKLLVKKTTSSSFKVIEYVFDILIQIKETTVEQVEDTAKLLNDNSIIQEHGLYQVFYYLYIKDTRLSKYLLSLPNISLIILSNNLSNGSTHCKYYDCKIDSEDGYAGYPGMCFNISDHLKPDEFTYEFIFSSSFDQVLDKLVNILSMTKQSIKDHSENEYSYSQLLNFNLGYFTDIHRMDLFFKYLEVIQMELKSSDENQHYKSHDKSFPTIVFQFDSPSTTIKSTCSLLSNNTRLKYLYENQSTCQPKLRKSFGSSIDIGYDIVIPRMVNSFKFESTVLSNALKLLTIDQIEKLLEFNFFVHQFQYDLLFESLSMCRFDIVDLIYTNFNIPKYSLNRIDINLSNTNYHLQDTPSLQIIKDYITLELLSNSSTYQDQQEKLLFQNIFLEYLTNKLLSSKQLSNSKIDKLLNNKTNLEKYLVSLKSKFEAHSPISIEPVIKSSKAPLFHTLLNIYNKVEFQSVVKSFFENYFNHDGKEQQSISNSIDYNENIFLDHFIQGDVLVCDLILLHFPDLKFKITKSSISEAINNDQITAIKYYFIKFIKPNNSLLVHLKNQLLNHKDYKYNIEWLGDLTLIKK